MTTCQTYNRPVIKAYDIEKNIIYLFQPRCKTWACTSCAYTNKLLWQAKISHGYDFYMSTGVNGWRFVTLTSHPKLLTADQCLHVFKSAWAKLSTRIRRKYPGIKYVLLPEHNKDGRVHWHMICSHGISERWLKDNAAASGLGWIADSRKIDDNLTAIFYVSKYIGKSIENKNWPQSLRRIRTSQKWPLLPPEDNSYEGLDVDWHFWQKYPAEGLGYIAYELELKTGIPVHVLSNRVDKTQKRI